MRQRIADYFATLARLTLAAEATDGAGNQATLDDVFGAVMARARAAHASGNKVMFIGNGGSAAIASHMAIDYTKNGGIRALAFNDGAALTCLGNDLGYAQVFARQIEMHARAGDLLIAISSSGDRSSRADARRVIVPPCQWYSILPVFRIRGNRLDGISSAAGPWSYATNLALGPRGKSDS